MENLKGLGNNKFIAQCDINIFVKIIINLSFDAATFDFFFFLISLEKGNVEENLRKLCIYNVYGI